MNTTLYTFITMTDNGCGLQPRYSDLRREVEVLRVYTMTVTGQHNTEVADVRYLDTGESCYLRLKHLETADGGDAREVLLGRSHDEIKAAGKALASEALHGHITVLLGRLLKDEQLSPSQLQSIIP